MMMMMMINSLQKEANLIKQNYNTEETAAQIIKNQLKSNTPLIVALSPGHSDITRFRPWSLIAAGNHLDRTEKVPKVAQTTGTVDVFDPRSGISGPTSRRASACPNLHE